jgi:uncharacterized RDD family membrane protein YckC
MERTNSMQIQWRYVLRRTGAYIADALLVYAMVRVMKEAVPDMPADMAGAMLFQNVIFALYAIILTTLLRGRTFGKMIFRLRVVRSDGGRASFLHIVVREFTGRFLFEASNLILLALFEYLGVLEGFLEYCASFPGGILLYYLVSLPWILVISFSRVMLYRDHLAIHDRISGTKVI